MAQIQNISNSVVDSILSTFGNPAQKLPVWNEGQKMFLFSEYESAAGNRYYKGLRFCNKLAIVETFGFYHTWTYIDSIEIYTFDEKKPKLAGKRTFDKQFYNEEFIKQQTKEMTRDFILGQLKMRNANLPATRIDSEASDIVERCYTSFLSEDFSKDGQMMLKVLSASNK